MVAKFEGTWVECVMYVIAKGMRPVSESPFSDQNRVYFAFKDGTDVFLDHSATVTKVASDKFVVADFSSARKI